MVISGCSGRDSIVRVNAVAGTPQRLARTRNTKISEIEDIPRYYYCCCSGRDSMVCTNAEAWTL